MRHLLDTNTILYFLGGKLADPLEAGDYLVSVISELELLSYPGITPEAEIQIRSFLSTVEIVSLTSEVKDAAIGLRRQLGLKLPDAIVVGTAVALNAELLTNDLRLLRLAGVRTRALPTRA